MSDKNTITEWKVEGEVTPEMTEKAARELDLAMIELIYASMRRDFEERYPIPAAEGPVKCAQCDALQGDQSLGRRRPLHRELIPTNR